TSIGLCIYLPAHPTASPLSASCTSDQRFACGFFQFPPRDGHPCRPANTSPCRACRELSSPNECALPGAETKNSSPRRGRSSHRQFLELSEVDLDTEAEVATHDVRASPCRVVPEQSVRSRRIELRSDVEHVQDIGVDRVVVVD